MKLIFSSNHLALLENTCVLRNVQTDLLKMRKEFDEIIAPFVSKNIQYFKYNFLLKFNLNKNNYKNILFLQ